MSLSLTPVTLGFTVSYPPCTETDLAGYKIHAKPASECIEGTFTPSNTNLIYKGPNTSFTYSTTVYEEWIVQVAAYDVFGEDNLNYSTGSVVPSLDPSSLLFLLTDQITSSQLHADLSARIDLIDIPTTGLVDLVAAQEDAQEALADAISTLNEALSDITNTPDYSELVTYLVGQLVKYTGGLYRALQETLGNLPTDVTYWEKIGDYDSIGDAIVSIAANFSNYSTTIDTDTAIATAKSEAIASSNGNTAAVLGSYSTTATMTSAIATAKSEAIATSNGNTASSLTSYTNTTGMNSAIATAKSEAIASSNGNTAALLTGYTNTTGMDSAIADGYSAAIASSNGTTAALLTSYSTTAAMDTAIASSKTVLMASLNRTFKQTTAPANPTGGYPLVAGDSWYDSDDSNKIYAWSGSAWVDNTDGRLTANSAAIAVEQGVRATTVAPTYDVNVAAPGYAINKCVLYGTPLKLYRNTSGGFVTASAWNATKWTEITSDLYAQYGVRLDVNGKVTGFGLSNDGVTSNFEIVADKFAICNTSGGQTKIPFVVGLVNGASTVGIDGTLAVDGSIAARSIAANSLYIGTDPLGNPGKIIMGTGSILSWGQVVSRPDNIAGLVGSEPILNSGITIDVSGNLQGIGSGANTTIKNQMITISTGGVLTGVGTANVVVDNSKVTLTSLSAMPLTPATPTNIGSNWIYTGTLTAAQVNAVAINAGSIVARADLSNLITTSTFPDSNKRTWSTAYNVENTGGTGTPPRPFWLVTNTRDTIEDGYFQVTRCVFR